MSKHAAWTDVHVHVCRCTNMSAMYLFTSCSCVFLLCLQLFILREKSLHSLLELKEMISV